MSMRIVRAISSVAVTLALAAVPAFSQSKDPKKDPDQIGNRDVDKGLNWYSIDKEIALGKALAQQIESQVQIVNDPVIAEFVNRLGQNLARNSDSKIPLTVKVIRDES